MAVVEVCGGGAHGGLVSATLSVDTVLNKVASITVVNNHSTATIAAQLVDPSTGLTTWSKSVLPGAAPMGQVTDVSTLALALVPRLDKHGNPYMAVPHQFATSVAG